MSDLIPRALQWLCLLLGPGTGHRRRPRGHRDPFPQLPLAEPLPVARSPYGLHDLLDGADSALVRPYLAVHERAVEEAAIQQRRRLALVLAADFGIDLDRHLIGAQEVAA
ncbi:hypothetical protein LXH13_19635 [Streptomyces spinosirectus]|uniref:hypothetical protein n=1 Tax=Streptomyces TaxID=1883 RepID=UPI001C9E1AE0|nr:MULTISPECIES: hypothetical protein [Streptomyces]MBY8341282.1 hypothetical protein [Streptomyces plumbidurans]UIR19126.1 hypothetical protein LXH13_19635 [Streptomyces spinosirectus]